MELTPGLGGLVARTFGFHEGPPNTVEYAAAEDAVKRMAHEHPHCYLPQLTTGPLQSFTLPERFWRQGESAHQGNLSRKYTSTLW